MNRDRRIGHCDRARRRRARGLRLGVRPRRAGCAGCGRKRTTGGCTPPSGRPCSTRCAAHIANYSIFHWDELLFSYLSRQRACTGTDLPRRRILQDTCNLLSDRLSLRQAGLHAPATDKQRASAVQTCFAWVTQRRTRARTSRIFPVEPPVHQRNDPVSESQEAAAVVANEISGVGLVTALLSSAGKDRRGSDSAHAPRLFKFDRHD